MVAGRVPARAAQEGAGTGPGAVSVGDRGLQLLQAAAAELRCVRLPVLRQLLGAHGLRTWGQSGQKWNTEKSLALPPP